MTYHDSLAKLWCQWNAQRGTAKQIVAVQRNLRISDLERMLQARGVELPSAETTDTPYHLANRM